MLQHTILLIICISAIPMFIWEAINGLIKKNLHLFLFFTIITNALTWLYFLTKGIYICLYHDWKDDSLLHKCKRKTDRFLALYSIFDTISIFIVFLIFWTMLAPGFKWGLNLKNLFCIFDHLIIPVLKMVDYLYFTPYQFEKVSLFSCCLSYPLLYYIGTTLYGIFGSEHYYPYWFMNPAKLSYPWIVGFFVLLLIIFIVTTYVFMRISILRNKKYDDLETNRIINNTI